MHTIEEQLESEGIQVTFKQLLAEAIFAGNCLVNYGRASPYQARTGRTPAMMPDLLGPPRFDQPGPGRLSLRLQVALQKNIESTALARITRAMRTVTSVAGEEITQL